MIILCVLGVASKWSAAAATANYYSERFFFSFGFGSLPISLVNLRCFSHVELKRVISFQIFSPASSTYTTTAFIY